MKNTKNIAYIQLAIAMIIVGSSTVFGKIIIENTPVFTASFLGLLIASIIFIPHIIKNKHLYLSIGKSDILIIFLQALLGTFFYRLLLLFGLKYTTAAEAGLITSSLPAIVALLSIIILKEKVRRNTLLGILLTIVGLGVISLSNIENLNTDLSFFIGSTLILLSVVCEALFSVLSKKLHSNVNPIAQSGSVIIISTILFFPFVFTELGQIGKSSFNVSSLFSIIYYGLFVTVVAFILWFQGLKKVRANESGVFMALVPVSALLLSQIILGEEMSIINISGCAIIISGIIFTQSYKKNEV